MLETETSVTTQIDFPPTATLLDTIETFDRFSPATSYRDTLGLKGNPEYQQIESAYSLLDESDGKRRHENLLNCRTAAYFARNSETGQVRVISSNCNLRWCPLCAKAKQAFMTHAISDYLCKFQYPKMLTLTLKHDSTPLSEQITRLYTCFQLLKKTSLLKNTVKGGFWFFHIKRNKADSEWHPHLHLLITGSFIPKNALSKRWLKITGDSPVADIRVVKSRDSAARHTARYAAKPANVAGLSTANILELITALHGRRIVGAWGNAKSVSLRKSKEKPVGEWVNVGSWSTVLGLRKVDDQARAIFNAWQNKVVLNPDISVVRVDRLLSGFDDNAQRPPPDYGSLF